MRKMNNREDVVTNMRYIRAEIKKLVDSSSPHIYGIEKIYLQRALDSMSNITKATKRRQVEK